MTGRERSKNLKLSDMDNANFLYPRTECLQCKCTVSARLHRKIFRNLSEHFVYFCPYCNREVVIGGQRYIPHAAVTNRLTENEIKNLPIINPENVPVCSHCGSLGGDNHHWAPKEIFGNDAGNWPQSCLCVKCHILWHNLISDFYTNKAAALKISNGQ